MRCSGLPPLANLTDLPPNPEIDVRCRILNMGGAALSNCMVMPHTPEGGGGRFLKHTQSHSHIYGIVGKHILWGGVQTHIKECVHSILGIMTIEEILLRNFKRRKKPCSYYDREGG